MHLTPEHLDLLKSIQDEWNHAEEDIKTAEMVVQKIVIPAVKELRYAGRRIVDVLMLLTSQPDAPDLTRIQKLLDDANFNCHKARHDAIDAATAKIAADLSIMAEKLGYDAILPAYPQFPALYVDLNRVRDKITTSRRARDNRDAIYASIEIVDFPALVDSFTRMSTCEPMILALAKKGRRNHFFGKYGLIVGIIGVIIAAGALTLAYIALKWR